MAIYDTTFHREVSGSSWPVKRGHGESRLRLLPSTNELFIGHVSHIATPTFKSWEGQFSAVWKGRVWKYVSVSNSNAHHRDYTTRKLMGEHSESSKWVCAPTGP